MNRRSFIQRTATGIAAVLIAAKLPASAIQRLVGVEATRESAVLFVTRLWNDYMRGRGMKGFPDRIVAGSDLYKAFEGELIANERLNPFNGRFVDVDEPERHLAYRSAKFFNSGQSGWWVAMYCDGYLVAGADKTRTFRSIY